MLKLAKTLYISHSLIIYASTNNSLYWSKIFHRLSFRNKVAKTCERNIFSTDEFQYLELWTLSLDTAQGIPFTMQGHKKWFKREGRTTSFSHENSAQNLRYRRGQNADWQFSILPQPNPNNSQPLILVTVTDLLMAPLMPRADSAPKYDANASFRDAE